MNVSTTQELQESAEAQLQSLENELFGKILTFNSYFINEILSLKDQTKAHKINDNVKELSAEKLKTWYYGEKELNTLNQRVKFWKDGIFSKQKRIDKLLDNNNELVEHQSHHVPVLYIQGNQSSPVIGSRSPNDSKYKLVDNNSFSIKLKENKNSNNAENHCVIKSTSKKEIMIAGDSMIKHVNGREVFSDDSVKIRFHPGATTDDIIDYVRPSASKKLDLIIIHTDTNDIQNKVNTLQKVRKVITTIKVIDVNNEVQIAV